VFLLKKFKDLETVNKISIIFLGFIFTFIVYRAAIFALRYDEAYTYLVLVEPYSLFKIIVAPLVIANNHQFNTILVKICVTLFGNSPFSIRLPSLFGVLLYFNGIYRISLFLKPYLRFIFILLITTNPLIFEFLGICRGYSLALGFFMLGINYSLKLIIPEKNEKNVGQNIDDQLQNQSNKNIKIIFLMIYLTLWSIITFLYAIAPLFLVIFLYKYQELSKKTENFSKLPFVKKIKKYFLHLKDSILIPFIVFTGCTAFFIGYFAVSLVMQNRFFQGTDSIQSMIITTITFQIANSNLETLNQELLTQFISGFLVIGLILTMIPLIILKSDKKFKKSLSQSHITLFIFSSVVLASPFFMIFIHFLTSFLIKTILGAVMQDFVFPSNRTVLFFIPSYFIVIISVFNIIFQYLSYQHQDNKKLNNYQNSLVKNCMVTYLLIGAIIFPVYGLNNLNYKDGISEEMLLTMITDHNATNYPNRTTINLFADMSFIIKIQYYCEKDQNLCLNLTNIRAWSDNITWDMDYDYYLIASRPGLNASKIIQELDLEIFFHDQNSQTYLAIPKLI
jgi:hypothetical protein